MSRIARVKGLLLAGALTIGPAVFGQQTPAQSPGPDSQVELERVHNILNQFISHPCQDIGAVVTMVLADSKLAAQQSQPPEVKQFLNLGVTLDEYLHAALVLHCLTHDQKQYKLPPFQWTIQKSGAVNAFANPQINLITITTGIIDFTRDDPEELAFAVAHEVGHLTDQPLGCPAALQRVGIVTFTQLGAERTCESRADDIGFQYLIGAGFNPYGAAAFFGRLQMYSGHQPFLMQFVIDHPVDTQRIEFLRNLFLKLVQEQTGMPAVR
jgi:predicted Zn-dependent protease